MLLLFINNNSKIHSKFNPESMLFILYYYILGKTLNINIYYMHTEYQILTKIWKLRNCTKI